MDAQYKRKICYTCKKEFFIFDIDNYNWVFSRTATNRKFFCSFNCRNDYLKKERLLKRFKYFERNAKKDSEYQEMKKAKTEEEKKKILIKYEKRMEIYNDNIN